MRKIRLSFNIKDREILAFVHIKKAAGTTLIHILRLNFFMRHCDIDKICKSNMDFFQADDMKKIFLINPFVRSIAGHHIKPYGDLLNAYPNIKYFTLLRDPIKRYISQYQYNVEQLNSKLTFDEYLETESSFNKQTQTIAGKKNVDLAKLILTSRFFIVGIVEEFDEFLILFKKKLKPIKFRPSYSIQNTANRKSLLRANINEKLHKYLDRIIERNLLDIELYNYIRTEILPKQIEEYGSSFYYDLAKFKQSNKGFNFIIFRYIDHLFRRCYCYPALQLIKKQKE